CLTEGVAKNAGAQLEFHRGPAGAQKPELAAPDGFGAFECAMQAGFEGLAIFRMDQFDPAGAERRECVGRATRDGLRALAPPARAMARLPIPDQVGAGERGDPVAMDLLVCVIDVGAG